MRYNGGSQELDKYGSTPLSPALAYAAEDDRAPPPFLVYGLGGKAAVQTIRRGGMGEFLAWIPELGGGVRGKKREGGWNPSFLCPLVTASDLTPIIIPHLLTKI